MADVWYVDYSDGQRTGFQIRNADISTPVEPAFYPQGTIRYVTEQALANPPTGLKKHITPAEYASLSNSELQIRYFYQGGTTDPDGGYAIGVRNAQRAQRGIDWVGAPDEVVYFCNDRTTLPSVANWRAYLQGAASVLGFARVGAYGFRNAIDAAQGYASAFVQSGRRSELHPNANYWQDNNYQPHVAGKVYDRILVLRDYSAVSSSISVPDFDEEDEMQPVTLPASPTALKITEIWDGRKAVLNVVSTLEDVFCQEPYNYGPNGGTGGGKPTTNGQESAEIPIWRARANGSQLQFDVPAGTTRVYFEVSSDSPIKYQIVPV